VLAPYQLLDLTVVDAGGLPVELRHVRRPDGKEIMLRRIPYAGGGVAVVALTEDNKLIFVRQWREAINRFTIEIPSGGIDPGETPGEGAARELLEETGYEPGTIEPLARLCGMVSLLDIKIDFFLARDCRLAAPSDGEADEPTGVLLLDAADGFALAGCEIDESGSVNGLLLAERHLRRTAATR